MPLPRPLLYPNVLARSGPLHVYIYMGVPKTVPDWSGMWVTEVTFDLSCTIWYVYATHTCMVPLR